MTDSDLCSFCQNIPDSIEHMFFQCEIIKEIQQELYKITKYQHLVNKKISYVGLLKADCQFYHTFVNYYILIAKAYIFFCKRKIINPDITHFKQVVRHKFEM